MSGWGGDGISLSVHSLKHIELNVSCPQLDNDGFRSFNLPQQMVTCIGETALMNNEMLNKLFSAVSEA